MMTIRITLKRIILVNILILVISPCVSGSPGQTYYEVVSADIWIEQHDGVRYLGCEIKYREAYKRLLFLTKSRNAPIRFALGFKVTKQDVADTSFLADKDKSYWERSGWSTYMVSHDEIYIDTQLGGMFKGREIEIPNGQDWVRQREDAIYIKIVKEDEYELGIPLVDGKYSIWFIERGQYQLDHIAIEVNGDNVVTQILKGKPQ